MAGSDDRPSSDAAPTLETLDSHPAAPAAVPSQPPTEEDGTAAEGTGGGSSDGSNETAPSETEVDAEPGGAGTERGEHGPERTRWRFVGSFPFLILVALGVAILIKSFFVQAFFIPSPSMEPTLRQGDRVLVNKISYRLGDVGRHDVIVFVNPGSDGGPERGPIGGFLHWLGEGIGVAQPEDEDYIKRVIGLAGEVLEIHDETVFIDGEPIQEPYLTREARECNRDYGPVTVPRDSLFVMGDNRCNSADSRYGLGFVPVDKVVGRAFVIIWPPSDIGGLG